jgi:hypothetical protein
MINGRIIHSCVYINNNAMHGILDFGPGAFRGVFFLEN